MFVLFRNMVERSAAILNDVIFSATDKGAQTQSSLVQAFDIFNRKLDEKMVKKPIVCMADGHKSRFCLEIFDFCQENQISLFLGPPDTTAVTQTLDQVNSVLHKSYKDKQAELFSQFHTFDRGSFMEILNNMWHTWVSAEGLVKAAKRCGITSKGLSIENMQQDFFDQAEAVSEYFDDPSDAPQTPGPSTLNQDADTTSQHDSPRVVLFPASEPITPESASHSNCSTPSNSGLNMDCERRRGKRWSFYKKKAELLQKENERLRKLMNIENVPGIVHVEKIPIRRSRSSPGVRLSKAHGSMDSLGGEQLRQLIEEKQKKNEEHEKKKRKKKMLNKKDWKHF